MHVALADVYRARWTDRIHEEWIRNVLTNRPDLARTQLERTRDLMNRHVRDAVVTGYESLIPALTLPDPDDRHVFAAAIVWWADVMVTFNLKDFPAESLAAYGIEAQHPDEFLSYQFDLAPEVLCRAAKNQRATLKNPPRSVSEFLGTLEEQGLVQTVSSLRRFADML